MDAQSYRNSFKGTLCSERMYILGLNIGHNATACLLKDGTIVGCVSEERFSRIKHGKPALIDNPDVLPKQAIDFCLKKAGITFAEINQIGISSLPYDTRNSVF